MRTVLDGREGCLGVPVIVQKPILQPELREGRQSVPPTGLPRLSRQQKVVQVNGISGKGRFLRLRAAGVMRFSQPTVAFVKTEENIQISIDAYKLLGVSRIASEDTIFKTYGRLIEASPEAELSQELLCSRAVVLKAVADVLLDRSSRLVYDKTEMLEIPKEDLPGAIAMLAEAGDWESALEWGRAWLSGSQGSSCARDVAVCVGIAQCDRAAAIMESSAENAREAAAALEAGSQLLKRYSCGETLQVEIDQTLKVRRSAALSRESMARLLEKLRGKSDVAELMPKIMLQELNAPEVEGQPRDIAALQDVLWREGAPVASFPLLKMSRRRYLEAVCAHLTACEQVQLFEGNLGSLQTSDEETYDAALAHLAHGLRSFTPASIKTAVQLMEGLDNKREPATGRKCFDAVDVTVELAVCHLLLGEVDAAESSLGLSQNSRHAADAGVRQFIQSQGGDDSLPGMYSLAQQWLAEVAAEKFPELAQAGVDFETWFNNPRVSLYLQVVDTSKQLKLDSAGGAVKEGLAAAVAAVMKALLAIWKTLLGIVQRTGPVSGTVAAAEQPLASAEPQQTLGAGWDLPAAAFGNPVEEEEGDLLFEFAHKDTVSRPAPHVVSPELEETKEDFTTTAFPQEPASNSSGAEELHDPSVTEEEASLQTVKARTETAVPLEAVANQTVGEIQQHIQDVLPLEEEEDGFNTDYLDAPIPQPPFGIRSSSRVPSLLAMEGEREMWASYQNERRRLRGAALLLGSACAVVAVWAMVNPSHFAASRVGVILTQAVRALRARAAGVALQAAFVPLGALSLPTLWQQPVRKCKGVASQKVKCSR